VADFSAAGRRDVRRRRATDVPLDGIERGDMFQRLAGNRRKSGGGEFVEVALDVGPVERKPDVAAIGQLTVAHTERCRPPNRHRPVPSQKASLMPSPRLARST